MKQSFLTKTYTALLLAFIATAWCNQAWAGIKIYVRTEGSAANSAPYLYVWNETGELNGTWSNCQMTETTTTSDGQSWYVKEFNQTNINAIIHNNRGGDGNKTPDLTDIKEDRYYSYKGGSEYYNLTNQYVIPEKATFVEGKQFVYFVNTSDWQDPHAHVYNNSGNITGNWPGEAMTKVENSVNLWKWEKSTSETPTNIIFNDGKQQGAAQSTDMSYTNGGYYNAEYLITTITEVLLNSTNFPDQNFRAALAEQLGVNEGGVIYPNNIKILNVSSKGISDLTGIANFTNLEELYAQNNSITSTSTSSNINVEANTKLKILNASNNRSLTHIAGIANCHVLEELYLDSIDFWPRRQITTTTTANILSGTNNPALKILSLSDAGLQSAFTISGFNNLKYLNISNNPNFNGLTLNAPSLEYLNLSNANVIRKGLISGGDGSWNVMAHAGGANLKYLDVSDNSALYNLYISDKTNLETIIMKNCTSYDYGSFNNCPNLKHADFSGCTALESSMWDHLKASIHTKLQYLNLSNGTTAVSGHTFNFPALDTLIVNNNTTVAKLLIDTHCPSIIDFTGDTNLDSLAITNCGLNAMPTGITGLGTTQALKTIDLTGNEFASVPSIDSETVNVLKMNNNLLSNITLPSGSKIKYLYAQNNNFPAEPYSLTQSSLVGLDLANNSFTEFTATRNESLLSLSLSPNDGLKIITLHDNALTQTSPDGKIESDNGLYIRYLSSLDTLNIEHSSFKKLGQEKSLEGVSNLKKLQARDNKFTTFTNSVYDIVASGKNYRPADPTESSLEYLTSLEYLDLSYNELRDSVHLYYNTALKHLDVSHNRHITGVYDGSITTTEKKKEMRAKKAFNLMKYGKEYNTPGHNPDVGSNWVDGLPPEQASFPRPFDLRDEDLNDTTGLYHLDLGRNVNLEWLDFSYTNIHNTAAGPGYMNPGWMDIDWVTDMGTFDATPSANTQTKRVYSSWHTYVYFIPCSKLKTIHADHNNMNSFGFRYFPELDTLTCSYMYGDCARMRDCNGPEDLRYGYGNTSISPTTTKFDHYNLDIIDDEGNPKIIYERYSAEQQYFPNPIKYLDVSNSGFNEFRVNPGVNLEYVNLSGNPLNFNVPWHDLTDPVYNSLDLTYCPNIKTVKADNCSNLPTVRAHNRSMLTSLDVTGDTLLKTIYVQNDEVLPAITGLSTLTRLETLFAYNNILFGANNFDVSSNTALKNLWISNIGIDADALNLTNNTALEKLRVYDNTLTVLDVTKNTALTWLDFARNKVPRIDLSKNTALQFFNCSNSSENLAELAKTVTDNHDGSDFDTSKPSSIADTQANNGHNSLSDLVFAANAPIADVRANYNDLHYINGSFGNLKRIEFAHNHINGINLSAAINSLSPDSIVDNDNGREITAEFSTFSKNVNNVVQEYKVYFFQLAKDNQGHGAPLLEDKTSTDSKNNPRVLDEDGFVLSLVNAWGGSDNNAALLTTSSSPAPSMLRGTTVKPEDLSPLDPNQVQGTIVVLNPTEEDNNGATGRATYTYNNGISDSEFYLDWSSDGQTVTGINGIAVIDGVSIAGNYGSLTVNGADGTVVDVYDMSGRQVARETIGGGSVTIDGLTPGIYIVNGNKVVVK